jgi:hypothetical protein
MLLRDIVEIDQQGLIADAVNLSMMADLDKNLPLCQGFVFNYDETQPKLSTLGVLDALRESFHSANNANVHLMVQDFGKGKSHFALTVANFFKQPAGSPEVEGILDRIKFVTSEKNQAIYERIKSYKNRSKPHLVLCISGEISTDLGKALVQVLQCALEEHGIGDTLAQHFIQDPLNYLQELSINEQQNAETYLKSLDDFQGNLSSLIDDLKEGRYDLIPIVKDLSAALNKGRAFDFELNLNIEAMLNEVIQDFCTGENRKFEGILILFDELNAYLRAWLKNPNAAGGWALHNLTNACEQHRSRLALLCLAQVQPTLDRDLPETERIRYKRFTSRIELPPSTYEPKSSLELVIDNLLKQSECAQWKAFRARWDDTLRGESRTAYERYITAYSNQNWPFDEFYRHLGIGCYPLHPLTSYLLCNLEFTHGRTAIQFIKEDVASFLKTTSIGEELSFVRPVQLMDAFKSNFAQKPTYIEYEKAYSTISASASEDEITVLKAIGLYYLSGAGNSDEKNQQGKIKKSNNEGHEEILAMMTGFSVTKTKDILIRLKDDYQVVYFNSASKTYRFYTGVNVDELRRRIEDEIENKIPSLNNLRLHCQKNLSHYMSSLKVRAESFSSNPKNRLNGEDWQFERRIFTIDQFQRSLTTEKTISGLLEKGLIAYFIGEYDQDMIALEKQAEDLLSKAPKAIQEQVIIAIPRRGTRDLARVLLMKATLNEKGAREKQEYGPAFIELIKQFDSQLDTDLQEIFDSCVYTCRVINKIPIANRRHIEPIVSKMLEELYTYVPPVEGQDKLRTKSTAGSGIVSYASRQLLGNELKEPFPNQSYNTLIDKVFVQRWRLLKPGRPFTVQIPQDSNIRQAWDTISEMTDIGDRDQNTVEIKKIWEVLSSAPFGHNELTFTMLFSTWLAYHRAEIELSGAFGIPKKKSDSLSNKSAPIHEWMASDILAKPKDFVSVWVVQMRGKVVRRKPLEINIPDSVNHDSATNLLEQINVHRQSGLIDLSKLQSLEQKEKQLRKGIQAIDDWYRPTQEVQSLLNQKPSLDTLAKYYALLEVSYSATIKQGVTTVRPTEDQFSTWKQTRQNLRERIEVLVEAFSDRTQSLKLPSQGYNLKAEIEHQIKALENITDLPSRFLESLQSARDTAEQCINVLEESEKNREVLEQVQNLFKTLGANATQCQYSSVGSSIRELGSQNPSIQQDKAYQKVLHDIEVCEDELIQKLDRWGREADSLNSPNAAYQLSELVNRETNRFDQEDSRKQIESLALRIKAKILEGQDKEAEEASLKEILGQATRKAKDVSSLINVSDAIQTYDELSQIVLPSTQKIENIEEYRQQLGDLQADGKCAIEQKFEQLFQTCDRDIKKLEEYTQRKVSITRAYKLVGEHSEFSVLQERLQVAEAILEAKYEDLKKRVEDAKLMRDIQALKLSMGNTIKRCEEVIIQIEDVRSRLHFPDQHQDTIDRLLKAFQGKRAEYSLSLDELTSQIQTTTTISHAQHLRNDLSELTFVFRDSADYSRYEAVDSQLRSLLKDLECIDDIEAQSHNAQSIAAINQVLAALSDSKPQLHDLDRFQEKLQALESSLRQRQQQYIDNLTQWQHELNTLTESRQARSIQSQIVGKNSWYIGSDYEESYDLLKTDLDTLTQLLALADAQRTETIEACQTEIERLEDWQKTQLSLSDIVHQRLQALKASLVQTQQDIQERRRNAAHQWLSGLQGRVSQLSDISDSAQKLQAANALYKEIRQSRNQHDVFLADDQKDFLRELIANCEAVQNQDRASKIETLFKELPREERVGLYQRLSAYLEATTEVF